MIVDDEGKCYTDLSPISLPFLPHNSLYDVYGILRKDKEEDLIVTRCRGYDKEKEWMSNTITGGHPYIIIDKITKNDGMVKTYSSRNDMGGFVSGVIISNSGKDFYNDFSAEFGIGKGVFKIKVSSKEEGDEMIKALKSKRFQKILNSVMWNGWQIDYRFFKLLKKDFWKAFINDG